MLLPIILLAGCGMWVVNEAIEIFSSGMSGLIGITGTVSNGLLCAGICVFWGDRASDLLGRIGVVLAATGMAILTWRSASLAFEGLRSDTAPTVAPLFLVGALGIAAGVILIGIWIIRSRAFPAWIGVAMIGCTLLSLVLGVLHVSLFIQSGANIVLAVILAETAVLAMGRRGS